MLSLKDILATLEIHKELLKSNYGVDRIGVFGSYARGEQTETSDIDLIVEFAEDVPDLFEAKYQLRNYLAALFNKKVDLANREAIRPYIISDILRDTKYAV